jgi:predicted RNA binding protein YcfA (HicA-like mRNA interferase family)
VNDFGKAVREQLEEGGCTFVRHGKGDHDIWRSPNANRPIAVPVKIKSRHLANKILKETGLSKCF